MHKLTISSVVFTTILSLSTTYGLTISVYTDKALWQNSLAAPFLTEDFADSELNSGVSFDSSESGHINPAEEYYQDVLTSQSENQPTTIWNFNPGIFAYGGNWTLGGPGGSGNALLVYLADSAFYVGSISNSYSGEFWGFISDVPFTSVQLIGSTGLHQQNYRLDDMVYAQIPDPATMSLLAIGGMIMISRRKKHSR